MVYMFFVNFTTQSEQYHFLLICINFVLNCWFQQKSGPLEPVVGKVQAPSLLPPALSSGSGMVGIKQPMCKPS